MSVIFVPLTNLRSRIILLRFVFDATTNLRFIRRTMCLRLVMRFNLSALLMALWKRQSKMSCLMNCNIGYEVKRGYHAFLGFGRGAKSGRKVSWRVFRWSVQIAPSSASGASSCTRLPRSSARVCSIPTCISGLSLSSSL